MSKKNGGPKPAVLPPPADTQYVPSVPADATTTVAAGTAAGVTAAKSVDIGCVRITEAWLHSDPPTAEELSQAVNDLVEHAAIDPVDGAIELE